MRNVSPGVNSIKSGILGEQFALDDADALDDARVKKNIAVQNLEAVNSSVAFLEEVLSVTSHERSCCKTNAAVASTKYDSARIKAAERPPRSRVPRKQTYLQLP